MYFSHQELCLTCFVSAVSSLSSVSSVSAAAVAAAVAVAAAAAASVLVVSVASVAHGLIFSALLNHSAFCAPLYWRPLDVGVFLSPVIPVRPQSPHCLVPFLLSY